jgi:hypothetical protein
MDLKPTTLPKSFCTESGCNGFLGKISNPAASATSCWVQ